MNLETKRKLDHYLGTSGLLLLQIAARLLGFIFRFDHGNLPVRSILIMKFQGLGSVAIAKPEIQKLRARYPSVPFLFWGTKATTPLARLCPEFTDIIELNDRNLVTSFFSVISNLLRIWKIRPHWVFDLEPYSKLSSCLATLSCGRNRAGFAIDSVKLRENTHTHLIYFNRYEYLGRAYGVLFGLLDPACTAANDSVSDQTDYPVTWKLNQPFPSILPEYYAVINPHAGDLCRERQWPRSYFLKLVELLLNCNPKLHVVVIGHGPTEEQELKYYPENPRLIKAAGKLSLAETVLCFDRAAVVVSNDSGPLHCAIKTKAPVVALFGPTKTQAYLPPERPNLVALHEDLYCSPCVHHWMPPPCRGNNQCMKRISVQTVFNACARLLKIPSSEMASQAEWDKTYYPGLVYDGYREYEKDATT